jgi:transcription-repair coupling factor (superfamily II helicase)
VIVLNNILNLLKKNSALPPFESKKGSFYVGDSLGIVLLVATAYQKKKENYVIVTSNLYQAQRAYSFLLNFLDEKDCLLFPQDDLLRADVIAANKELEAQRIYVLHRLLTEKKHIIITNLSGFIKRLTDKDQFAKTIFKLKKGDEINIRDLSFKLADSGYQRVGKVNESLQFSNRGEILDIFSINYAKPVRIDSSYDVIDTISTFDISTQRSDKRIDEITILPANEIIYSDENIEEIRQNIDKNFQIYHANLRLDEKEKLEQNLDYDLEKIQDRSNPQKAYQYSSFSSSHQGTLVDYIDNPIILFSDEIQLNDSYSLLLKEQRKFYDELVSDLKTVKGLEYYVRLDNIKNYNKKIIFKTFSTSNKDTEFKFGPLNNNINNVDTLITAIYDYERQNFKVLIALDNKIQFDTVSKRLKDENIDFSEVQGFSLSEKPVNITYLSLPISFELGEEKIAVITSHEIFRIKHAKSRFVGQFRSGTILQDYEQLEPGDYVVHEYYGIGQYIDVVTREVNGIHRDFLHIAYAGTDELYTPLEQFHLIRKYAGKEGAVPKLNSLGGTTWERTKKRIKDRIDEITDVLLENQAKRIEKVGIKYPEDDIFQQEFENNFPYELTPDQKQALIEIKEDMEKETPMDRLLCGDVGFGKTELAFRAAFKAINSGKLVAFLCPTTLLARQHYEVAIDRFKGFGINIGLLSRLVPEKEQRDVICRVNEGKIHLLIGTHRLLSDEINYDNLGLLIVDEEQRFGVAQKEKIKTLSALTDILTLSATPIPRTLQMSLVGLRSLSQINTPPQDRMPIQIYVIPKKNAVIKELIERELQREGQVFYLHNRISTINSVARNIEKSIPSARVGIVHGKMLKDDIEDVMVQFYDGDIDVLVCTSIIENGIDVSNANLIIVDDAANFGLAQLYQIKGRVGRSNRIAYAYLLYTPGAVTETGKKRLKAIQDFAQLGSGYKIAQRDLMIRGAGDLLGKEQAGFIDSVGIDMYLKMVKEVIDNKTVGKQKEEPKPVNMINIDAYIPSNFADKSDKIEIYQEIKEVTTIKDLQALEEKVRDIYGRLPSEVELLFRKKRIDIIVSKFGKYISSIEDKDDFILIELNENFSALRGGVSMLVAKLSKYATYLRIIPINNLYTLRLTKRDGWFEIYEDVIKTIGKIIIVKEQKNET